MALQEGRHILLHIFNWYITPFVLCNKQERLRTIHLWRMYSFTGSRMDNSPLNPRVQRQVVPLLPRLRTLKGNQPEAQRKVPRAYI